MMAKHGSGITNKTKEKSVERRPEPPTQDKFLAKLSFFLSLFSWIPLLNLGISFASLYLSYKAIKQIRSDSRFGGFYYALIAMVISAAMLFASIIVFVIYVNKKLTCEVVECSNLF